MRKDFKPIRPLQRTSGSAGHLLTIGRRFAAQGQRKIAKQYFEYALRLATSRNELFFELEARHLLTICLWHLRSRKECKTQLDLLIKQIPTREPAYEQMRLMSLLLRTILYSEECDWNSVIQYASWALEQKTAPSFRTLEPIIYWYIAEAKNKLSGCRESIKYLELSLKKLEADSETAWNIRKILVKFYLENKQYQEYQDLERLIFEKKVALLSRGKPCPETAKVISEVRNLELKGEEKIEEFLYKSFLLCGATVQSNKLEPLSVSEFRLRTAIDCCKSLVAKVHWQNRKGTRHLKDTRVFVNDWIEVYLLFQSHACWLSATQAALSGQVVPTYLLIRGALENAMYAAAMVFNSELRSIWLSRHDGVFAGDKDAFTTNSIFGYFREHCPPLEAALHKAYKNTIEHGAHPNPTAKDLTAFSVLEDDGTLIGVSMLQGEAVADLLRVVLETAELIIDVVHVMLTKADIQAAYADKTIRSTFG